MGGIGQPHGPDAAIAPGLLHEPGTGIVAVRRLSEVFLKGPFRAIAATTILIDHDIAMADKEARDFLARLGALRVVARAFRTTRLSFPIRRAFENDRERPRHALTGGRRAIDIARQLDAIPHRDHDIGSCTPTLRLIPLPLKPGKMPVWSKNSCGFALVVFEEASKPFTIPNRACTFCVLADSRKEKHVALALM